MNGSRLFTPQERDVLCHALASELDSYPLNPRHADADAVASLVARQLLRRCAGSENYMLTDHGRVFAECFSGSA